MIDFFDILISCFVFYCSFASFFKDTVYQYFETVFCSILSNISWAVARLRQTRRLLHLIFQPGGYSVLELRHNVLELRRSVLKRKLESF